MGMAKPNLRMRTRGGQTRVELARFVLRSMGIASLIRDMRDPDTRHWWHIMNKAKRAKRVKHGKVAN